MGLGDRGGEAFNYKFVVFTFITYLSFLFFIVTLHHYVFSSLRPGFIFDRPCLVFVSPSIRLGFIFDVFRFIFALFLLRSCLVFIFVFISDFVAILAFVNSTVCLYHTYFMMFHQKFVFFLSELKPLSHIIQKNINGNS